VKEPTLAVGTSALVGLMLSKTAAVATMVTLADADLVRFATLVALTWSVAGEGAFAGAA